MAAFLIISLSLLVFYVGFAISAVFSLDKSLRNIEKEMRRMSRDEQRKENVDE